MSNGLVNDAAVKLNARTVYSQRDMVDDFQETRLETERDDDLDMSPSVDTTRVNQMEQRIASDNQIAILEFHQ